MAAPRSRKKPQVKTLLDEVVESKNTELNTTSSSEVAIEDMPLKTLGDYVRYNERARAANKKLGICRYKAKPCPEELHPMQRIIFQRNDQPSNPLPVFLSNHMIHYDRTAPKDQLRPGQTYDLPLCVIDHLADKGTPVYDMFDNADGSRESRMVSKSPRFAIRTIYKAD